MSKIVRVTIHDGLLLPSGFLAQADYHCFIFVRAPDEWVNGDGLAEAHHEALLEQLYGPTFGRSMARAPRR